MREEDQKTVVAVRVTGVPPDEWHKEPGRKFRERLYNLARRDRSKLQGNSIAQEVGGAAYRAVQGAASKDFAAAENSFTDAEEGRIRAELARRALDADVAKKHADAEYAREAARKKKAQADIAELQAFEKRIDLEKKYEQHLTTTLAKARCDRQRVRGWRSRPPSTWNA